MFQGSKGVVIKLIILLLAFANSQTMSFGQSATPPVTYTYTLSVANQATTNNCTAGEPVNLNGIVQFSYQVSTDPTTGANQFSITASNNLTGVGQSTAGNYTASDSADYILNSSQPSTEATVQLKANLASQGAAPSMTLVQTLDIVVDTSGNISAQVTDNSTQCGN
jgi:hypothetical protein